MTSGNSRSDGVARAYSVLRGAMLVLFSVFLIVAPERALPGSSTEPARSIALIVASRTILLGSALIALALARKREALAWVLLADAALQIFDTLMAFVTGKGALAALPALLFVTDAAAGFFLLRAVRSRE
jgi:hypothetical protein